MGNDDTFVWELVALALAGVGVTAIGASVVVLSNKSPETWSSVWGLVQPKLLGA